MKSLFDNGSAWVDRDWQQTNADDIIAAFKKHKRVLYVAPQGAGKTLVATMAISRLVHTGKRVLWLTPTRETAIQAVKTLRRFGLQCAFILSNAPTSEREDASAPIHVGTVASVRLRDLPDADVIVIDEAHHAPAETWEDLVSHYKDALNLGLTGSPWRLDGQPLGDHFDVLLEGPKPSELIAKDQLSRPLVYTWDKNLALPEKDGSEYSSTILNIAAERILVADIFETRERRAKNAQTIVFASTIEHSISIVAGFVERGVSAEHIDSRMSYADRDAILLRFQRKETQVLSTVGVLSEGWDMPEARCMISARPMRSLVLWLQQCGRVMRAGARAVILDHAGNALRLRHPAADRTWSLDGHASESVDRGQNLVPCPCCNLAINPQCRVCPECGHEFDERERLALEHLAGELVPLREMTNRQLWDHFVWQARWKGVYIDYAEANYKKATGEKPPHEWYPTDRSGFGDVRKLREAALWLGKPRSDADEEFKALRSRGEFLPQPFVRMPQGVTGIKRIAKGPASKVPLADAPHVARASVRTAILRSLKKHKWNIEAACKSLELDKTAILTHCKKEYEQAKRDGLVMRFSERYRLAPGMETMTGAAKRYGMTMDGMRKRLIKAGVIDGELNPKIHQLRPVDVDKAMKAPIKRNKPTGANKSTNR